MLRWQQRLAFTQADGAFNSGTPTLCFGALQGILTALRLSQRASNTRRRWYDCCGWVSRLAAPSRGWQTGPKNPFCRLALAHLS